MPWELLEDETPSTGLTQPGAQPKQRTMAGAIASVPARVAETTLGFPGDVASLGGNLLVGGLKKLDPKFFGKYLPDFVNPLPTSEQLRGVTKAATGGALEPTSARGRSADDFITTLTQLALPLKYGGAGTKEALGKAAKIAGLGTAAKSFSREVLGLSEGKSEAIKLGTILASSIGTGIIDKAASKAYEPANAMREGIYLESKPAYEKLTALRDSVKEKSFPRKNDVLDIIDTARDSLRDNTGLLRADYKKVWEATKASDDWYNELSGTARSKFRQAQKILRDDFLYKASELVRDPLMKAELEPVARGLKVGDDLWRDIRNQRTLSDRIGKYVTLRNTAIGGLGSGVLGVLPYFGIPTGAFGAAGAGAILGATGVQQAAKVIEPFLKSKPIRNAYYEVWKAAGQQNAVATVNGLKKFSKVLKKEAPELAGQWEVPE